MPKTVHRQVGRWLPLAVPRETIAETGRRYVIGIGIHTRRRNIQAGGLVGLPAEDSIEDA